MSAPELKPCPFCGGGITSIEGKGQIWRGTKGYSQPQYYELNHFGKLSEADDFPRCNIVFRCRTEAEAITAWNTRADLCDPLQDERVKALIHALVVWDAAHRTGQNEPLDYAFDIGKAALSSISNND